MKKEITKGVWKYRIARLADGEKAFGYTITVDGKKPFLASAGVYECHSFAASGTKGFEELEAELFGQEEIEANAILIADAGNTYHSCNLLPSEILRQRNELLQALIDISSNKHLHLGDKVYDVREAEGEGWEGEWVKKWSDAVSKIEELKASIKQQ